MNSNVIGRHTAVRKLLDDMKAGKTDSVAQVKGAGKVRMEYSALRDAEGNYLGCLETCGYVDVC